jgi:hypothetical protein
MTRIRWKYKHDFVKEVHMLWRVFYYNPETFSMSFRPIRRDAAVTIVIYLNSTFRILKVDFIHGYEPTGNQFANGLLLENLRKELANELMSHNLFSYQKDVEEHTIDFYEKAYAYIDERMRTKYGKSGFDKNLKILCIPQKLWRTYNLVGVYAYYSPKDKMCVFPQIEDHTTLWANCIKVHESFHAFQHMSKILLRPDEIGMTSADFSDINVIIEQYNLTDGLEKIANVLGVTTSLLKRVQIIMNKLNEYHKEYYNVPTERHAFAEQFNFLKSMGVSAEKIIEKMLPATPNENQLKLKYIIENSEQVAEETYEEMIKMID